MHRDVSASIEVDNFGDWFSLHAQRCFLIDSRDSAILEVFSACAEMFLPRIQRQLPSSRFFCIRRDVSGERLTEKEAKEFSLHAQRCFYYVDICKKNLLVFSASAETFP